MTAGDANTNACLHLLAAADREVLESCSAHCRPGDTVLLIDAGVLQLIKPELADLIPAGCRLCCLLTDLEAHGLSSAVETTAAEPVDDSAFPVLLREHRHCLSWT